MNTIYLLIRFVSIQEHLLKPCQDLAYLVYRKELVLLVNEFESTMSLDASQRYMLKFLCILISSFRFSSKLYHVLHALVMRFNKGIPSQGFFCTESVALRHKELNS